MDFSKILNWRLLKGSHEFPGPDGGTCINEAAVIAAGMPYRKVRSIDCLPPCFSRPIGGFALAINDAMGDGRRNELMPFVTRIAGTKDEENDPKRADYIITELVRRCILPLGFVAYNLPDWHHVEPKMELAEALDVLDEIGRRAKYDVRHLIKQTKDIITYQAIDAPMNVMSLLSSMIHDTGITVIHLPRFVEVDEGLRFDATPVIPNAFIHLDLFGEAIKILDEAIKLGRQAPDADVAMVKKRMDAIRLSPVRYNMLIDEASCELA
ncbi:hypothetical protein PUR29_34945 [Methylobacterium ajmalii]|uniref:Uncharacterized protein n=1 Tax=Methylobacterium ajmalii TaxID=2738439 RepID=A0ABV0A590_9HYPH